MDFLKNNKPWAAERVAILAIEAGKPLPDSVVELAGKLEDLLDIPSELA